MRYLALQFRGDGRMSITRLFDVDPLTGAVETFYYDDTTDTFTIERAEDVEPLVDTNLALANMQPERWSGEWHHVASIPATVLQELRQQGILRDPQRFRAWLNDRDNRRFRTRSGRV